MTAKKPISDKKRAWLYKAAVDLANALRSGEILVDDLPDGTVRQLQSLISPRREPVVHELKCWPEPFRAIWDGRKRFEIRKADRDFRPGDKLHLREWDPNDLKYTGFNVTVEATYMVFPGEWGMPDGLCAISLSDPIERSSA